MPNCAGAPWLTSSAMPSSLCRRAARGGPFAVVAFFAGAGIFSVQAAESRGAADVLPRLGSETIQLRRTGENHFFLSGRLNGRKLSCLVDTGWSFTTLQADQHPPVTALEILQLGRTAFTNQPMRVEEVSFHGQRAAFDLVLGLDFLRPNFAVLDCSQRRLFTRRTALSDEAQSEFEGTLRRAGFRQLELRVKTPPALTLTTKVNGEPLEMLLDSGAVWSCVDERQHARLKLKPLPSAARISGAGGAGWRSVAAVEVRLLQLGEVDLKNQTLALFDLADWGFAAPDQALGEVQGILGGDLLAANCAVIDCHRLKLWLKPEGRK